MKLEILNKEILIDGKPELILSGEIHYFRLPKSAWQDRIDKLKAAGMNAVASYVPWICHEEIEGEIDLTGRTREELDLFGFIDLCKENGLYFILRPGPFIMAEMKNEGIPYWVYEKHPEIIPVTWDGQRVPTKTIDYLACGFLQEVEKWYAAMMPGVAERLITKGGNIIGVQLDNEIGMLSWVSNSPDLTDHLLADFVNWLKRQYPEERLTERYPFSLEDKALYTERFRSPEEGYALRLLQDLGHYMRNRFARYVETLRGMAESHGVRGVPFIINIHGTGGGRGLTFPIGISQLFESYTQREGYLSGSDIYFGDLDIFSFQDLYLINGMMDSLHRPEQPLTAMEFNCGDANFGETYGGRLDPSAVDFKTRMCVAQGNRLLNFYLFAGGRNARLKNPREDGNGRIAFTGERHGFAAPVSPEGELNYTYPRMARVNRSLMAVKEKVAVAAEEFDDLAFAWIPDYFMTEYYYPKSEGMKELVRNLERNRASESWEIVARAMLLNGFRFRVHNLQHREPDLSKYAVLVLPSAGYMAEEIQRRVIGYLEEGGKLLLYGEIPEWDMEKNRMTLLANYLGVKPGRKIQDSADYYPSAYGVEWAAARPEVRINRAETFEMKEGIPFLKLYGSDELLGAEIEVGKGKAIVMTTSYPCHLDFFKLLFERLGVRPGLAHHFKDHGIFMTTTRTPDGERFLHLINMDGFDKTLQLELNGERLFEGREYHLPAKEGVMLPLGVTFGEVTILSSTAEITDVAENHITFRGFQEEDVVLLRSSKEILSSEEYRIAKEGEITRITANRRFRKEEGFTICFH